MEITFADSATVLLSFSDGREVDIGHHDVLQLPYKTYYAVHSAPGKVDRVEASIEAQGMKWTETLVEPGSLQRPPQGTIEDRIREWVREQIDLNAGVECERCEGRIGYRQGTSSPVGSMHHGCARAHEANNPALW